MGHDNNFEVVLMSYEQEKVKAIRALYKLTQEYNDRKELVAAKHKIDELEKIENVFGIKLFEGSMELCTTYMNMFKFHAPNSVLNIISKRGVIHL